eukprot:184722-Hanusia_phi.AAC.1
MFVRFSAAPTPDRTLSSDLRFRFSCLELLVRLDEIFSGRQLPAYVASAELIRQDCKHVVAGVTPADLLNEEATIKTCHVERCEVVAEGSKISSRCSFPYHRPRATSSMRYRLVLLPHHHRQAHLRHSHALEDLLAVGSQLLEQHRSLGVSLLPSVPVQPGIPCAGGYGGRGGGGGWRHRCRTSPRGRSPCSTWLAGLQARAARPWAAGCRGRRDS